MSSCCLSGKVHDGQPVGHVETIGGLQTYVSAPEDGSKAKSVIFITDSKSKLSSNFLYVGSAIHCVTMAVFTVCILHLLHHTPPNFQLSPSNSLPSQSSAGNSPMFASSPITTLPAASTVTYQTYSTTTRSRSLSCKTSSLRSKTKRSSLLPTRPKTPPSSPQP